MLPLMLLKMSCAGLFVVSSFGSAEPFFILLNYLFACLLFRWTCLNTFFGCKYLLIINICSLVSSWETCWLLLYHSFCGWHSLWNNHRVKHLQELITSNWNMFLLNYMFCCFFRVGQVVNITAKVNRAFTSSMEVCGIYYYLIFT